MLMKGASLERTSATVKTTALRAVSSPRPAQVIVYQRSFKVVFDILSVDGLVRLWSVRSWAGKHSGLSREESSSSAGFVQRQTQQALR